MVESFVTLRGGHYALMLYRRRDLLQSLSAEIHRKREFGLLLHHRVQNICQRL